MIVFDYKNDIFYVGIFFFFGFVLDYVMYYFYERSSYDFEVGFNIILFFINLIVILLIVVLLLLIFIKWGMIIWIIKFERESGVLVIR